jgi:DNA-binding transcriptional ArsR family regulator
MMTLEKIDYAKDLFKVLSTNERIRVANVLCNVNEIAVGDIADIVGIQQSMTSRYLADLRKNRMADYRRDSQINFYSLLPEAKELMSHILLPFQHLPEFQADIKSIARLGY